MSDSQLIEHCSPTLAAIKTASLFSSSFSGKDELYSFVRSFNRRMKKKGLVIMPLRRREDHALLYVWRPAMLRRDLCGPGAAPILRERGYPPENPNRCIAHLTRRLNESRDFPHEIGLFLGYPPQDVKGFIEQGPNGCRLSGCRKVYGDTDAAQKQFEKFRKCRRIYRSMHLGGCPLERLTVRT